MFNLAKAIIAAVIVLTGVASASAGPLRMFQDQFGAWHIQDPSETWHRHSITRRPAIVIPPVYVLPFTFEEQQRINDGKGNIG